MDSADKKKLGFLADGGEMGELIRNFDWEHTSIGKAESWPSNLKSFVGLILHSASPMLLFWGKDLLCFYNDALKPSLFQHDSSIGKIEPRKPEKFWDSLVSRSKKVIDAKEVFESVDQEVSVFRSGKSERVYWTITYSPIFGGADTIDGVLLTCTDSSARIIASDELRTARDTIANQDQLLSNFEQSPVAIATISKENLTFRIVNSFYAELVGRKREELVNRPLLEALPELKGQGFDNLLRNVMDTGVPFMANEVAANLLRNGTIETVYVNLTYQPQRHLENEITGILVVATDVTQQVRSRKKVEESEEHLQLLRNAVPAMIFYMDAEQRYRSYNGVFMDWFKVNATEALGKTTREFIGEAAYQMAQPHLAKAYAGERVQYDMHAPKRIGGEKWLSIVYTPHKNSDGNVIGVIVHATDITEYVLAGRKIAQKEKELRDLITASPIGICVVSGSPLWVEEVNERFLQISGKTRAQYSAAPYWEVLQEVAHIFQPIIEEVFSSGQKYTTEENQMVLIRDGVPENIFLTFEYIPVFENDRVIKVIVMVVEVTHQAETRKKIEEAVIQRTNELAGSNLRLSQSNEELEQFAYIASHDLQEPIRKISTFTQMLEKSLVDPSDKSKDYIRKIFNSTDRMSNLVRDVLAFSRITDESSEFTDVNLNEVIQAVKTDFELQIVDTNAMIESANLPTIKAIPGQMVQLFGNLMSNSLKYRNTKVSPSISISVSKVNDETLIHQMMLDVRKKFYQITLSDNGIGFKKGDIDKIFRIFQRLHGKAEYEGTGIGLAICVRIVQKHGGYISADVNKGGGAVFNVFLPQP